MQVNDDKEHYNLMPPTHNDINDLDAMCHVCRQFSDTHIGALVSGCDVSEGEDSETSGAVHPRVPLTFQCLGAPLGSLVRSVT